MTMGTCVLISSDNFSYQLIPLRKKIISQQDRRKISFSFDNTLSIQVWYNNDGWTAIVSYMNVMNNLILRSRLNPGQIPEQYGITTVNYPMNATVKQVTEEML